MTCMNKIEEQVFELVKQGVELHDFAAEIWFEMQLREIEKFLEK